MIKAIILLFNLLAILFSGLFFPDPITVSQTAPSTAQTNNSILVQVTINKGELNGLGKFVEKLPPGFTAVPVDDEGAQTSFDSNTIAFVWSTLPSDNSLEISFRVNITPAAAAQNYSLLGRFIYTSNNQNSEADCTPSSLTITAGAGQGNSAPQINIPQNNVAMQSNSTPQNVTTQSSSSVPATSTMQPANTNSGNGGVFVVRQFSSTSITPGNDATVTLTIHKGTVSGFAKIEDSIPPGFTANGVELKGSSFTLVDTRAKFVWGELPADSVINISYRLSSVSGSPGTHIVVGNFSYLYNNNPFSISTGSNTFNSSVISANNFANQKTNLSNPPPTIVTESAPATSANTPVVANNPPPVVNTNATSAPPVQASTANTTSTPPPATNIDIAPAQPIATKTEAPVNPGIIYKVQIMALHNPVSLSYFKNRNVKEHISTESDGGLTKYTLGNFTDYTLVKETRDNMRNRGFEGAFIVTYKSGVRLSLEDAMKISH